jgi:exonuclease VII small subunit
MKNTRITYKLTINNRTFSCSSILRVEDDILARIEALRLTLESKNNIAKEGESILNKGKENLESIANELVTLSKKSLKERRNMTTYLEHFTNFMAKADKAKAEELLAKSKKMEELFNKKIIEESESESDNSSMLKLIRLMKTKEKIIHDAEDKVESLIDKSVEKDISKGEHDITFQIKYLAARALRLKERKEFKEEENKVFSESTSKLSSIDHIIGVMETEMPSYTDPED